MTHPRCCMHGSSLSCRSLRDCHERCGVSLAAPEHMAPAPAITTRRAKSDLFGIVAISGFIVSLGLPIAALLGQM